MLRFALPTIRLTATALLVVFLGALLGPLLALATAAPREHLHLPGMPQAHHHHEDEHGVNRTAVVPLVAEADHPHQAYPGDDEQQLTSVAPVLKLLNAPALVAGLPPPLSFRCRPQAWSQQPAVVLGPPARLKPKIPDLRIWLGSLLL